MHIVSRINKDADIGVSSDTYGVDYGVALSSAVDKCVVGIVGEKLVMFLNA